MNRATGIIAATLLAASAFSVNGPPLAGVWNIATSGTATSSGDLAFRIVANDGSDPVDITVAVSAGENEDSVARSIRRTLGSQLPGDRYNVRLGEGNNVLISDPRGRPSFSLELLDSSIKDVRVAVQSVTLSAPPTVPRQSAPVEPPPDAPPANSVPGEVAPPADSMPPPSATPAPDAEVPPPRSSNPAPAAAPVPSPGMSVPNPTPAPSPAMPVPNPPPAPRG